jgi:choline dehydrogenase
MTYIRGQKAQVDAWETIGNTGWNWATMLPYYKLAEKFIPPTPAQVKAGASYEAQYNGMSGHVHVSFPFNLQNGTFEPTVQKSWASLSLPRNPDVNSGDVHGFDVWPRTVDRDADLRYDSATSYYWPVAGRTNLHLFQGTATKLTWKGSSTTASGVQYLAANGSTLTLGASQEVIISAGALRTPALLESSGVGNPK